MAQLVRVLGESQTDLPSTFVQDKKHVLGISVYSVGEDKQELVLCITNMVGKLLYSLASI